MSDPLFPISHPFTWPNRKRWLANFFLKTFLSWSLKPLTISEMVNAQSLHKLSVDLKKWPRNYDKLRLTINWSISFVKKRTFYQFSWNRFFRKNLEIQKFCTQSDSRKFGKKLSSCELSKRIFRKKWILESFFKFCQY